MAADKRDVDEGSLYAILAKLRDVRAWAVYTLADPWAFRQALITVLAIDTAVAFEAGVSQGDLAEFDVEAKYKAEEFIKTIPRGSI